MSETVHNDPLKERVELLFEGARKIVMSRPRCYIGDPDLMTEEQVQRSMKMQDEQAIIEEFRRLLVQHR